MKYALSFIFVCASMNVAGMQTRPKNPQTVDCCMLAGLVKAIATDCYCVGVCKSKDFGYAMLEKPCELASYYLKDNGVKIKQE